MNISQELALVKKSQEGDKESLSILWDSINPKLYGYLLNVLQNRSMAEDILQETWYKAIKSIRQFKPRGVRFSAWIFAISRNICREYWRQKNSQELNIDEMEIESKDDNFNKINNNLEVEKVFSLLSKEDQEIIRLRYIGEMCFKEIATILEISIVSARVKTHRAIKRAQNKYVIS